MRKMMKHLKKTALIAFAAFAVILGSTAAVQNYSNNDDAIIVAGDEYPTIEFYSLTPHPSSDCDM